MTALLVIAGVIATLGCVVIALIVWESFTRRVPAVAPAPAGPSATPFDWRATLKKSVPWVVGVAVVFVLCVGMYLMPSLSSKDIDWKLWIPIAVVLAGAINGLRYAGKNSVWLTVIVIVGCLAWLGMYVYYGDKAPEVAKTIRERNYEKFKNSGGASSGNTTSAGEKEAEIEWVVTNLPVQLPMDDQGVYVPGKWSSPWEKPRGANHRCEYYSDVGVGRWYAIKTGENAKPLNLPSKEYEYVRLDDSFKTYYFMILLEGKGGFEVIQRCPA